MKPGSASHPYWLAVDYRKVPLSAALFAQQDPEVQAAVLAEMQKSQDYPSPSAPEASASQPAEASGSEPRPESESVARLRAVNDRVAQMERQVRENEVAAAAEERRRQEEAQQRVLDEQLARQNQRLEEL